MEKKGLIYVVTHKYFELSSELFGKGYKLISVGAANDLQMDAVKDNSEDNISDKNSNYCELTALYWIWKNDKNSDIKGICHYRRYLTHAICSKEADKFVSIQECDKMLENYDIILPEMQNFTRTASENYLRCGYEKDLALLRSVISDLYPDYIPEYDKVFNGNKSFLTNMMIANRKVFDEYCEWLFNILFEVENKIDISGYSKEEARVFGYMSERLLTVWVQKNKLKVKCFHPVNTEDTSSFRYYITQVLIKLHLYQGLKTIFWKMKSIIGR